MAFFVFSLTVLAMLSSPVYSTSCDFDLAQSLDTGKQETFRALDQMGKISFHSCLKFRTNFRFPEQQLNDSLLQKAEAMTVLQAMLQQTFLLFLTERSSALWDPALLDQLRTGLLRKLQDLEACLVEEVGEEDSDLGAEGSVLAVKRYFLGIQLYLKEKKYSDCAWEVVRVEILRHFLFANKLIKKTQHTRSNLILSD